MRKFRFWYYQKYCKTISIGYEIMLCLYLNALLIVIPNIVTKFVCRKGKQLREASSDFFCLFHLINTV